MAKNESIFDHPAAKEAVQKLRRIGTPSREDFEQAVHDALIGINREAALEYPPVRSLQEILAQKSIKELNRYARAYGLKNLGGAKKEAVLARLMEAMTNPQ